MDLQQFPGEVLLAPTQTVPVYWIQAEALLHLILRDTLPSFPMFWRIHYLGEALPEV